MTQTNCNCLRYKTLKVISAALIFSFGLQEFSWALPEISTLIPSIGVFSKITVPLAYGRVREYQNGSSPKFLIHIQDAHTNLGAQRNIAAILEELIVECGVHSVFIEGGTRDDSLDFLRPHGPPGKRKQVANKYLIRGELSGAEYLSLGSDLAFDLVGVEERGLYIENLRQYAALAAAREKTSAYLARIQQKIDSLKPHFYPPALLEFDALSDSYRKGTASFTEYHAGLSRMAGQSGVSLLGRPHYAALAAIRELEGRIDFKKANEEQQALLRQLGEKAPKHEKNMAALAVKNDWLAFLAYYEELLSIARGEGAAGTPNLEAYTDYLRKYESLNSEETLGDIEAVERETYEKNLGGRQSRLLYKIERQVSVLKKIFSLEASRQDFDLYERLARDAALHTFSILAFLNKALLDLGRDAEVLAYDAVLERSRSRAEDFYRTTLKRDEAMVQKTLERMETRGLSSAVLITGGYHTENLKALLKKKNVSYAVIAPHVLNETNTAQYEKTLISVLKDEKEETAGAFLAAGEKKMIAVLAAAERPGTVDVLRRELSASAPKAPRGARLAERPAVQRERSFKTLRAFMEKGPLALDVDGRLEAVRAFEAYRQVLASLRISEDKAKQILEAVNEEKGGYQGRYILEEDWDGKAYVPENPPRLVRDKTLHRRVGEAKEQGRREPRYHRASGLEEHGEVLAAKLREEIPDFIKAVSQTRSEEKILDRGANVHDVLAEIIRLIDEQEANPSRGARLAERLAEGTEIFKFRFDPWASKAVRKSIQEAVVKKFDSLARGAKGPVRVRLEYEGGIDEGKLAKLRHTDKKVRRSNFVHTDSKGGERLIYPAPVGPMVEVAEKMLYWIDPRPGPLDKLWKEAQDRDRGLGPGQYKFRQPVFRVIYKVYHQMRQARHIQALVSYPPHQFYKLTLTHQGTSVSHQVRVNNGDRSVQIEGKDGSWETIYRSPAQTEQEKRIRQNQHVIDRERNVIDRYVFYMQEITQVIERLSSIKNAAPAAALKNIREKISEDLDAIHDIGVEMDEAISHTAVSQPRNHSALSARQKIVQSVNAAIKIFERQETAAKPSFSMSRPQSHLREALKVLDGEIRRRTAIIERRENGSRGARLSAEDTESPGQIPVRLTVPQAKARLLSDLKSLREKSLSVIKQLTQDSLDTPFIEKEIKAAGKIVERMKALPAFVGFSRDKLWQIAEPFLAGISEDYGIDKVWLKIEPDLIYTKGFSADEVALYYLNRNDISGYLRELDRGAPKNKYALKAEPVLSKLNTKNVVYVQPSPAQFKSMERPLFAEIGLFNAGQAPTDEDIKSIQAGLDALLQNEKDTLRSEADDLGYSGFIYFMAALRHNGGLFLWEHEILRQLPARDGESLAKMIQNSVVDNEAFIELLEKGEINRPVDVAPIVRERMGYHRAQAGKKGLEFELAIEESPLIAGYADPNLLKLVVDNLMQNAVKYTDRGKVSVRLGRGRLTDISGRPISAEGILLEVSDTGIGIPEADQEKIHEKGKRGSNVGDRPGDGFGLGFVNIALNTMNGWMRLESEQNKGSTFTVYLGEPAQGTRLAEGSKNRFHRSADTAARLAEGEPSGSEGADQMDEIESIGSRLAAAVKPRASSIFPVFVGSLPALFAVTPKEAQAFEISVVSAPDVFSESRGALGNFTVNLKEFSRGSVPKRNAEGFQEARSAEAMKNRELSSAMPQELLEGDLAVAIAVPVSVFGGLSADAFRAQAGDLVRGAYEFYSKKYGKNFHVYLTGEGRLDGAGLSILQELVKNYSAFISIGEAEQGTATMRLADVEDGEEVAEDDWKFSYPVSPVSEMDQMGWFAKFYFAAGVLRTFGRMEKTKPSSVHASDVPQALLDAQAALSARAADAPTFSGIVSNRIRDPKRLAPFRLVRISRLIGDAISILEKLKRSFLSAA